MSNDDIWLTDKVLLWLRAELLAQRTKFSEEDDLRHVTEGIGTESFWQHQLEMYLHRASVLGLDQLNGRQALAKFVATAAAFLKAVVRVYGDLPEPGHPSGELHTWSS
jgi:hypothetical protein